MSLYRNSRLYKRFIETDDENDVVVELNKKLKEFNVPSDHFDSIFNNYDLTCLFMFEGFLDRLIDCYLFFDMEFDGFLYKIIDFWFETGKKSNILRFGVVDELIKHEYLEFFYRMKQIIKYGDRNIADQLSVRFEHLAKKPNDREVIKDVILHTLAKGYKFVTWSPKTICKPEFENDCVFEKVEFLGIYVVMITNSRTDICKTVTFYVWNESENLNVDFWFFAQKFKELYDMYLQQQKRKHELRLMEEEQNSKQLFEMFFGSR